MENSFEREMLEKIVKGERLTERELSSLVYEGEEVDEIEGEDTRWTRCMTTVINLCGKNVAIDWQKGLTECQENEFYDQPYFVEKKERVVTVVDWVKTEPELEKESSADEYSIPLPYGVTKPNNNEANEGSFLKIYRDYIKNASEKENEDDKDYE